MSINAVTDEIGVVYNWKGKNCLGRHKQEIAGG